MLFLLCLESDAYLRLKNNVWMAKHLMKLVEFFVFVFCQCGFLPLDLGEVGFSAVCFLVGAVTSVMVDFLALAVSRRCHSISACCSSFVLAATGK